MHVTGDTCPESWRCPWWGTYGGVETTSSFLLVRGLFPAPILELVNVKNTNNDSLKACHASNLFRESLRAQGLLFSQAFCRRIVPCRFLPFSAPRERKKRALIPQIASLPSRRVRSRSRSFELFTPAPSKKRLGSRRRASLYLGTVLFCPCLALSNCRRRPRCHIVLGGAGRVRWC